MLKKTQRDLEVDLFSEPKRSILLLKSKKNLSKGVRNMILKRGEGKNMSLTTNIHPCISYKNGKTKRNYQRRN